MTETEALRILRAQGHAVGTLDHDVGTVRVWARGTDFAVDVNLGTDLIHLAGGKITLEDLEAEWDKTVTG